MTICFKRNPPEFDPITIEEQPVDSVTCAKLVGLLIQADLKWDANTDAILRKAPKKVLLP